MATTVILIAALAGLAIFFVLPRTLPGTRRNNRGGRTYSFPQFAILAIAGAIFMALTLFTAVSLTTSLIFMGAIAVGTIFTVRSRQLMGIAVALASSLIGFALVFYMTVHASPSPLINVGGSQAQAAADPGTGTPPKACPAKFEQKWDPNQNFRFASDGLKGPNGEITAEVADQRQRALIGHDARYLAVVGWVEGKSGDPNNVTPLLTHNKKCLSKEGITLYSAVIKKWNKQKVAITNAPANGRNSGSDHSKFVKAGQQGISGDRRALKRGKNLYLTRCGNPVLPGGSTVPSGHTDTPSKPHTPQTPKTPTPGTSTSPPVTPTPTPTPSESTSPPPSSPPATCPPGQTGTPPNCLETKGPVIHPSDDPTNPAPSGPASSPDHPTHKADPTDKPGDPVPGSHDGGVDAPGSSSAPADRPTDNPQSGGDTGHGDTDPDPASKAPVGAALILMPIGGFLLKRKLAA